LKKLKGILMLRSKALVHSLVAAILALGSLAATAENAAQLAAQKAADSAKVSAQVAAASAAEGAQTAALQGASSASGSAAAETRAPDVLVREVSTEVLEAVKTDPSIKAGDTQKVAALVDAKVMPHMNFQRMTSSAVGRNWRQATPEQQKRLQEEFKLLLVRTYAGALGQVKDHSINLRPMRSSPADKQVVVRTEVRGKGEPIQLDYRMEKTDAGWKIYDMNILGVWLVENYRGNFAQEINASGINGLIAKLVERNKAAAAASQSSKS
jgi:phospholipid transport system substrate-binding protein